MGLPTWALVDGTWAALSQLANNLPEGYNISAYLILALTIGNLSPVILGLYLKRSGGNGDGSKRHQNIFLQNAIRVILCVGFTTGILMSIFWKYSVQNTSLPLYILFFVVGMCSSTSNVTHYTFVSKFEATNTTALATGMGLGSMTAGILGILQGLVLINYGFSASIYYAVLSCLYLPAIYAFQYELTGNRRKNGGSFATSDGIAIEEGSSDKETFLLDGTANESPFARTLTSHSAYSTHSDTTHSQLHANSTMTMSAHIQNQPVPLQRHQSNNQDGTQFINQPQATKQDEATHHIDDDEYSDWSFVRHNFSILSVQAINSFLGYGIVPAIISYACGKFKQAQLVLLLATAIGAIVDPWTKFMTNYFRLRTITTLWMATCCLITLCSGLILCAALPTDSSLYTNNAGGAFPVILYVSFAAFFGFTNTCVFRYYKEVTDHQYVHHAYRWSGIASQSGALVGSVIAFALVVTAAL